MKRISEHRIGFLFVVTMAFCSLVTVQRAVAQSLTYSTTDSEHQYFCSGRTLTYTWYTYKWTYTDSSGGTHTFPFTTGLDSGCFPGSPLKVSGQGWSTDGLYYLEATASGGSIDGEASQGFVNPKFIVVGITYAPPGSSSYVAYGNTTTVGNTATISSSFSSGTQFTVAVAQGITIPSATTTPSGTINLTYSSSTDYTQSSNTSTSNTISKASAIAYQTPGYATSLAAPQVPSDYDTVWLWLNPLVVAIYQPAVGTSPATVIWQGYAYDPNDPAGTGGPDVYPVLVGYLNGHFPSDPSIDAVLARTWTSSEDLQWPSGQGPGLTATDEANIVALDPFTNPNYTELSSLPTTSADGRFTQGPYPPNPIPFTPGSLNTKYTTTQTTTQTTSQQTSTSFEQAFGISEKLSGSFFGFFGGGTTLTEQQTFTWTHSTLNSLTTSTAISDGLSITGPPTIPTYTGPTQYIMYQDNLFGTFAFPPS